jgi:biotin operon repressor
MKNPLIKMQQSNKGRIQSVLSLGRRLKISKQKLWAKVKTRE